MQDNPFAPQSPAPAKVFVGRDREVDLVYGHIRGSQRGNVAISGPLGMGKTSLLRYLAEPAVAAVQGIAPPEYALLYVDVHAIAPFSAPRFWHRVAQLLSRRPELDLADAARELATQSAPDIVDLETFLDTVADRGAALVLLLDEFEWVVQVDGAEGASRDFLAQLASLARRTPRTLSLVVATEAPLTDVTRVIEGWRGSPFATIFTSLSLAPLSRGEADNLFDLALGPARELLSPQERAVLYGFTGGNPAALQAAAFGLFHAREHGQSVEQIREAGRSAAAKALEITRPDATGTPVPETDPPVSPSSIPGGLYVDSASGDVYIDSRRVASLTALEYNLLRLLHASAGHLCSKEDIIRQVWGSEFVGQIDDSRVEKLVSRLRRKVEPIAGRPQYVRTVRGRGYRYVP